MRGTTRQRTNREYEREHADREVDEEDQAPPDIPEVGVDECTGEDRCAEHRHAGGGSEETHHLVELDVIDEDLLRQTEALGDHQRTEGALQYSKTDQHADTRRHRTGGREQCEPGRANEEESAATEDIAESRARDQQDGERQGVAGAQPLQGAWSAAEVAVDRRARRR